MANNIETILRNKLTKAIASLPKVLANEAVNFSLDAFKNQSWEGRSWAPRKDKRNQRALLIRRGILKRATRSESVNAKGFILINDIPYAKANNYGFTGTVSVPAYKRNRFKSTRQGTGRYTPKGRERTKTVRSISGSILVRSHNRRMNIPARQFMGKSNLLIERLVAKGKQHLIKSMNT